MKLIPNWRDAWRMTSVQISAVIAVLGVLESSWPLFQSVVSPVVFGVVTTVLAIAVKVARVVYQPSLHRDDDA